MKNFNWLDDRRLVAIEKTSGCAYLRAIFAAWRAGDVVLPFDPAGAHQNIGLTPTERIAPVVGGGWFSETITLDESDAPAQISMTSGTTGQPKAILISRRALSDVTHRLIDVMGLDASIREYIGVPLTYSFGLGRARAIATAGGSAYLPEHGFRADELAAMLRSGQVNALSAVPTLLRLVLAQKALFVDCGNALRWLEIGSQYMSGGEKAEIRALFPNACIVQHYGLTEASRTSFLRIDKAPEASLESVGSATGDVRLRVDDEGLVCIAGPHLADGRIVDGALSPIVDAQGWLRTSDRGKMENGLLYYLGRADDVLNVSGVKVSAEHFEQELLERTGLDSSYVAVAGRIDPLRGESVMVAHLADVDADRLGSAANEVAVATGLKTADVTLTRVDVIPRTETGKVQRNLLTQRHGVASLAQSSAIDNSEDKLRRFYNSIARGDVKGSSTFLSLNGDSLTYVQATIVIEEALGTLPDRWEQMSLNELIELAKKRSDRPAIRWKSVEGEMIARMMAIVIISANHAWFPDKLLGFSLAGGSYVLLLIFGYNIYRFRHGTLLGTNPWRIVWHIFKSYILLYYLVIAFFSLVDGFDIRNFLLIGTFWGGPQENLHMYWFFEAMIHQAIILAAIFSVPWIRQQVKTSPANSLLVMLVLAVMLRIVGEMLRLRYGLPPRTPDMFLYLCFGGMVLAASRTSIPRLLAVALILLGRGYTALSPFAGGLFVTAIILLTIFPRLSLPSIVAAGVQLVARNTLYIYLLGAIVLGASRKVTALHTPLLEFLLTISAGIALGLALNRMQALMRSDDRSHFAARIRLRRRG